MKAKSIYSAAGSIAPLYDLASKLIGYKKSVDYFVRALPFEEDAEFTVLDAGCGTGPYSLSILTEYRNAKVVAFDNNPKFVARAKERVSQSGYASRAIIFNADIESPLNELNENSFTIVITAGVLEYVPLSKTIRNLSRFLALGGFFFDSPVRDTTWGRIIGKLYATKPPYSRAANIHAFEENGFTLVKVLTLPSHRPTSFKEGLLFKKLGSSI